jgi:hypothetical protein
MHLLATTSRTSSSVPGICGGLKDRVVMWQVRTYFFIYRIFIPFIGCLVLSFKFILSKIPTSVLLLHAAYHV